MNYSHFNRSHNGSHVKSKCNSGVLFDFCLGNKTIPLATECT